MIETYPIPVPAEDFVGLWGHRAIPSERSPREYVAMMIELEQSSKVAAALMFAELSEGHKTGNMFDAVDLTLLYPDPSDDQQVHLKFNTKNYWQVTRGEKWVDLVINDELVGITGGYLLNPSQDDVKKGKSKLDLLIERREELSLKDEDYQCYEGAGTVCAEAENGVQRRNTLSTWEYNHRRRQ